MTTLFLSYSQADRALAERLVRGLRASGLDAWFDVDAPGIDWRRELERQMPQLDAVVVLWSPASEKDAAVRDAAWLAKQAGKLINAVSGVASAPFPYGGQEAANLAGWTGDEHLGWRRLLAILKAPAPTAGTIYQPNGLGTKTPAAASTAQPAGKPAAGVQTHATAASGGVARVYAAPPRENPVAAAAKKIVAVGFAAFGCIVALDIWDKLQSGQAQSIGGEYLIILGLFAFAGMIWKA